ncbi:Dabb family protein [Bacillus subtilis]|uniref:Dabb family protein n=1 Tax=Pseudochrobactrum asaccharolyticum TaxID=354351 RepID=UPI001F2A39F8|nr:Dabb family protein [Pseudochrobactrum asaccharolyticum]MCF7644958.1 Dabb family protein [Pseudochrobactrum asaccharolyticum]MCF7671614.1 Dabb family protein [Bacillus subtilis]
MRIFIFIITSLTFITNMPVMNSQAQNLVSSTHTAEFTAPDFKTGTIQHIVLFRYKPEVTGEQRKEVFDRFLQLKDKAKRDGKPYIVSIKAGAQNTSLEGAGQNFDQAFIVEFRSEGDRNYYVGTPAVTDPAFYDPAHQKFKTFVGPLLEENGALVYDFLS